VIIHADMPSFGEYRVQLGRREITPQVYMADDVHDVVILRHWSSFHGGYVYSRVTGEVRIISAKTAKANRKTNFGRVARLEVRR
jgi:hypothetical protein